MSTGMHPSDTDEEVYEGFRKTRAGVPFSPWFANLGVPLHAPADFHLLERVQAAIIEQDHLLAAQEDESALCCAPLHQDDLPVSTPEDVLPPLTSNAPDFIPMPPIPTPAAPTPVPYDNSLTKAEFRRKKHKKEQRLKKRMSKQDPDMNRPAKGCAMKNPIRALTSERDTPRFGTLSLPANAQPATSSGALATSNSPCAHIISELRLNMDELPVASTAFTGILREPTAEELACTELEDFSKQGFQYVKWDGIDTLVILDHTGTWVICTFSPAPKDVSYRTGVNEDLMTAFQGAREKFHFPQEPNRRGEEVKGITVGVSMGGGQPQPGNIKHTSRTNAEVAEDLRTNSASLRVANHGNALLQQFHPELYKLYDETLTDLCDRDPTLRRNFTNNVFACTTFNVGERTATKKHTDFLNLAYGMCAITALGNYDHTRSGHIVLWELRMVVEFPATSTCTIPSAVVSHSNIGVREGETRHSFTQYSAGGLFRWREAGHQTLKNLRAGGGSLARSGRERWSEGVGMLGKWDDFQRRRDVFMKASSDQAA